MTFVMKGRAMFRRVFLGVSIQVLIWGIIVGMAGIPGLQAGRARLCVVAVRDSGLFTMCPSRSVVKKWGYPGRTLSLEIVQNPAGPRLGLPRHIIELDRPVLDRSRAGWWDIIGNTPGSCPSGVLDLDLRKEIETELSNQDEYELVDSVDRADVVFLAEGLYADRFSGFMGVQAGRYRPSGRPMLAVVMAVAVPADVYAAYSADSDLLLEARSWEGSEAWAAEPPRTDGQPAAKPASMKELVGRFLRKENGAGEFPALCAARTLVPSVDCLGQPRPEPSLKDPGGAMPVRSGNIPGTPGQDNVFKVNVELVTVPTIVRDEDGKNVADLSARDFHLSEDGVEQRIDRVIPEVSPFNVVLMLDTSGSTLFKHSEIQNAALAFVETLRPEDRVMIVSFDSFIYLDSPFTTDRAALRQAILKTDTGAGTRLYDALDIVLTECLSRVQGRKAIVLFSDGIDTQSRLAPFGEYRDKVEESDVLVYAVQYDSIGGSSSSKYLRGISENSGGRLFVASSLPSLAGSFTEIADELQHQYTLCYYPSEIKSAVFRKILVTVDKPGLKIRARTGYRVAGASK